MKGGHAAGNICQVFGLMPDAVTRRTRLKACDPAGGMSVTQLVFDVKVVRLLTYTISVSVHISCNVCLAFERCDT